MDESLVFSEETPRISLIVVRGLNTYPTMGVIRKSQEELSAYSN